MSKSLQERSTPGDSGQIASEFSKYPRDWMVVRLGEVLERVSHPVEVFAEQMYQEIGIRSHGKGLFYKEPVLGKDLGDKAVFWIEPDCLILNIVFAWEQAVGMTSIREKGMIASHRFPMWKSKGNIELAYLLRLFLTPFGKHLLEAASPGGAGRNKTLGQEAFKKSLVCIPASMKEQRKIVNILTAWDQGIALKEQLIAEKKRQKKWLLENLLTGQVRLPGYTGEWQEVRLGDVFSLKAGHSAARSELQTEEGICYLHYGDIHKSSKSYIDVQTEFDALPKLKIANDEINESCLIYEGDVVFVDASEDSEGICKYVAVKNTPGIPFIAGLHTIIASPLNDLMDDAFKQHCFSTSDIKRQFALYANGISVYGISKNNLGNVSFFLPPLPEQRAIAEVLSTADQEIDLHERQLEELKRQRQSLMQLLLTGKIRVTVQEGSNV